MPCEVEVLDCDILFSGRKPNNLTKRNHWKFRRKSCPFRAGEFTLRGLRVQKIPLNDSAINWKLVGYTVAGCWMMFAVTFLPGKQIGLFLNPLPILLKDLAGIVFYGYVGGIRIGNLETIFVYWNVIGLLLAWCLHKSKRKPGTVIAIVAVAAVLHVVLSALALFPAMLLAGR